MSNAHADATDWVTRILAATGAASTTTGLRRVLVLCRTQAMVHSLQRALAAGGGALGVEVLTPSGLAASAWPGLPPGTTTPNAPARPNVAVLDRIGKSRPGLESLAGDWSSRCRLHALAGGDLAGDPTLEAMAELAATGWACTDLERAGAWLMGRLQAGHPGTRQGPTETYTYDTVFSVGWSDAVVAPSGWAATFVRRWAGVEPARLTVANAWDRAILERLAAQPLDAGDDGAPLPSIPAAQVPDASAEVRVAVRLLLDAVARGQSALVLVPDAVTAGRLQAAARRNGLPIGLTETRSHGSCALAPALRAALDWFAGGAEDPLLRASQLDAVLTSPVVGRRLRGRDRDDIAAAIGKLWPGGGAPWEEGREDALSAGELRSGLRAARIVEAPLSLWIERFDDLAVAPAPEAAMAADLARHRATQRASLVLAARLRRLACCILGESFDRRLALPDSRPRVADVSGAEDPSAEDRRAATQDEQDAQDARDESGLSGPEDVDGSTAGRRELPGRGTLGALRRFLLDCRLRVAHDPYGQALLSALLEARAEKASVRKLLQVMSGTGANGWQGDGAEVLTYDDYDGRHADTVLLLGVHDKGIAAAPAPDPLLSQDAQAHLGEAGGRRRVVFRLLQALRAVGRARQALALVAATDSSGRAVLPPVELALDNVKGKELLQRMGLAIQDLVDGSYGLDLAGLPETNDRCALVVRKADAETATVPEPGGSARQRQLAIQASAEWYRAGRGHVPEVEAPPAAPDLAEDGNLASGDDEGDAEGDAEGNADADGAAPASVETLAGVLRRTGPLGPEWVLPYLGQADIGEGWLRDKTGALVPWSVTNEFEPLANNLYRFFVERVLRLSESEPIADELDARELGTSIHTALEQANPLEGDGIRWRVDPADVDRARADAVGRLSGLGTASLEATKKRLGFCSDSVGSATAGVGARWQRHWGRRDGDKWRGYVANRVVALDDGRSAAVTNAVESQIRALPGIEGIGARAEAALADWKNQKRAKLARSWAVHAVRCLAGGVPLMANDVRTQLGGGIVSDRAAQPLTAVLANPELLALVDRERPQIDQWEDAAGHLAAGFHRVLSEMPFGSEPDPRRPYPGDGILRGATLPIAGLDLPVRGKIDRVTLLQRDGMLALGILDYKTGKFLGKRALLKGIASLQLPQLPVYALILQRLLATAEVAGIAARTPVRLLGYDYVAAKAGLVDEYLVTDDEFARFTATLDDLVGRVRSGGFALVPLVDDKTAWGYPRGHVSLRDASRFDALRVRPTIDDRDSSDDPNRMADSTAQETP